MRDVGLETLLALDGTEYTEENGYWYKIEAFTIEPTEERPHGIRYNLTLVIQHRNGTSLSSPKGTTPLALNGTT